MDQVKTARIMVIWGKFNLLLTLRPLYSCLFQVTNLLFSDGKSLCISEYVWFVLGFIPAGTIGKLVKNELFCFGFSTNEKQVSIDYSYLRFRDNRFPKIID